MLPKNAAGFETGKQLIRSAGSVGANYRATRRAKSNDDFIYKINVVVEESDEALYWLEVIRDAELLQVSDELSSILTEASELTAIFSATLRTATRNRTESKLKKSNDLPNSGQT